jgi:hypothetical protein
VYVTLEDTLAGWTGPSSDTEQEKQERTERMVRNAIQSHAAFNHCRISVYAKGSYANNTNVRADSDVDVAVQCHDAEYWEQATPGAHTPTSPYQGIWTPAKLRTEVGAALRSQFGRDVDDSGSTAFGVNSSSARVDADVVPCFDYRYYFASGRSRTGTRIFRKDQSSFENYPAQQLTSGNAKNARTQTRYKKCVRVMKRVENRMFENGIHRVVPSFFIECLIYNCPDSIFTRSSWTDRVRGILVHLWQELDGPEPSDTSARWLEVNECKYLFHELQEWKRKDGRDFAHAAWNYLGYTS